MDPAKMKVVDLRTELGALGLDTKGNKPALVERLKKALEAKTGKIFSDTSILDTSTEEGDDPSTPVPATPRRAAAVRTTRRSSSSRFGATPAKISRDDAPKAIDESKETDEDSNPLLPSPVPEPVNKPAPIEESEQQNEGTPQTLGTQKEDLYDIDDEQSQSPIPEKMDSDEPEAIKGEPKEQSDEQADKDNDDSSDKKMEQDDEERETQRELTEEEEWLQLNERLIQKEKERIEREKKQAEDDAKRLEESSKDPIKYQRLKRKQEKKARWSNFYKSIEVTNEALTPPVEEIGKNKKEAVEVKIPEPELDEDRITLSWYDSDLNQYLELPELRSVVALSEGAFAHAWAGARATHGLQQGRVCYEVRVGSVVTTTESAEKESIANGLRIGWSTEDSTLHLGEGEFSWGYESTARAVNNGEFKEYGKQFAEKDVIGVYLDLESNPCTISYTLNGLELGTAYEFDKSILQGKAVFPHVLTKNTCYSVNLGYDRYNMLTKTKVVRKRIEIPVEQVLEEKRKREEEIRKEKEEAARKQKERKDKEKKEREERQRKKREERERARKAREAQERLERGEEMEVEAEKDSEGNEPENNAQEEQNTVVENMPEENNDEPKENGEKLEEQVPEVKTEPMDSDDKVPEKDDAEVKEEPSDSVQEVTEEDVFSGHVLDKRIKFVIRHVAEEELDGAEACLLPGYVLAAHAPHALSRGPQRPATKADCEVILMVGMPGSGKTFWARKHCAEIPDRRYNILSTGAIFDKMKVDCKPFRSSYEGKWDGMVSKCAKCVLKLLEMAKGRRRNYILDQTNVYPSAQRRKLREFEGYKRIAVCVVVAEDVQRERALTREAADGKEIPDPAVTDMKANFTLPEVGPWLDEVIYAELPEEEAKKVVEGYHQEAAAAGAVREKDKRSRSASRDAPPSKRQRSQDKDRRDYRRRDHQRDREDRWGTRWGPSGGGGGQGGGGRGRWGRERGGMGARGGFERGWGGPPGRNDFSRDRDNFRGGRGGPGGRQDRTGGPVGAGPGGPGAMGPRGPNDRFQRDNRPNRPQQQGDKRPALPGVGNQPAAAGTWQRGSGAQQTRGPRPNQQVARQDGSNVSSNQNTNQNQNQNTNQNQNQNQNQNSNQSWNQWAGGWGGWGNWNNQNQGWNNWNNWGWGNQGGGSGGNQGGGGGNQGGGGKQQWPNYSAQQWYQWQQWQQQQQGWQGYNQQGQGGGGNQQQGGTNAADAAQAWAQYYQNYGGANANNSNSNNSAIDKK